jgi:hypothetical protein
MATTTPQQNKYKNTLFYLTELLYMIFCFTASSATPVITLLEYIPDTHFCLLTDDSSTIHHYEI